MSVIGQPSAGAVASPHGVVGIPVRGKPTLKDKVLRLVKDDSGKLVVSEDDYEIAIESALSTYSKHRPDERTSPISGNGGHDYSLPFDFIEGFSRIVTIEYPVERVPAEYVDDDGYTLYKGTAGRKLRLLADTPGSTEIFNLTYTVSREIENVIPTDTDALAALAAAICLEILASAYAQTSDSTIGADSVNYKTKSSEFAARAKAMRKLYQQHLGVTDDSATPAASAVRDLDGQNYPGGTGRLTHGRRARERR